MKPVEGRNLLATSNIRVSGPTGCRTNGARLSRALAKPSANLSGDLAATFIANRPRLSMVLWCGAYGPAKSRVSVVPASVMISES